MKIITTVNSSFNFFGDDFLNFMDLEVDAPIAPPSAVLVAHAVVEHQSHQRVLRCLSRDRDMSIVFNFFMISATVSVTPDQFP